MANNNNSPIVIIGAGPTGLGAAYELQRVGFHDWILYERDDDVGGLSRSYLDEKGFTWDIGGHVVFSHYDYFTKLLDEIIPTDGWLDHERESWIRMKDAWVPYPFQNNIHRLPENDCAKCLEGLKAAASNRSGGPFDSFDDFIKRTFGDHIAGLFMQPYNRKVWAYDPKKLDAGWIADRVSIPDLARVENNIRLKKDDVSWGPNNQFMFPLNGGTGAIWQAIAGNLPAEKIVTGRDVVRIDIDKKTIHFAGGAGESYGKLISTIPLDRLATISGKKDLIQLSTNLIYSSVHVVGVGLKGAPTEELSKKCWIYFPEDNCPFYRVTHFSHYSPRNVADIKEQWSLMAEVSESPDKPVDAAKVVHDTIDGLVATGLISGADQVSHTWTHRVEYGYPTPGKARNKALRKLLPALKELSIYSRGRFGAWMYEVGNMDHSFMQGVEAAQNILSGAPEITIEETEEVNTAK
jgi:protoporphyrinogen oxidase